MSEDGEQRAEDGSQKMATRTDRRVAPGNDSRPAANPAPRPGHQPGHQQAVSKTGIQSHVEPGELDIGIGIIEVVQVQLE